MRSWGPSGRLSHPLVDLSALSAMIGPALAPPFLLLVREWQLKAEARWGTGIRTNGTVETQTGQRTNAECVALLTYCMMDLYLVKDDAAWTDTVSNPARGDRLEIRVKDLFFFFKHFSRQGAKTPWECSGSFRHTEAFVLLSTFFLFPYATELSYY